MLITQSFIQIQFVYSFSQSIKKYDKIENILFEISQLKPRFFNLIKAGDDIQIIWLLAVDAAGSWWTYIIDIISADGIGIDLLSV